MTCEACGARYWRPSAYAHHRFTCDAYAAMRRELDDLSRQFERRGEDPETVAEYNRRDRAIVARYQAQWRDTTH